MVVVWVEQVDSNGRPVLWNWASYHVDNMKHPRHDHPESLVAGTYYVDIPADCGTSIHATRTTVCFIIAFFMR